MTVALPRDRPKPRTFPAANLIAMFSPETKASEIASAFGAERSTIHAWTRRKTRLSVWAADRRAVQIGCHPAEVWLNWYADE